MTKKLNYIYNKFYRTISFLAISSILYKLSLAIFGHDLMYYSNFTSLLFSFIIVSTSMLFTHLVVLFVYRLFQHL